jgi:hypothetical protein
MKKLNAIKGATYRRSSPKKDSTWNKLRAFAQSNLNDPTYGSRKPKPRVKTLEKPAAKATVIPHAKPAIKSTLSVADILGGMNMNQSYTQREYSITGS